MLRYWPTSDAPAVSVSFYPAPSLNVHFRCSARTRFTSAFFARKTTFCRFEKRFSNSTAILFACFVRKTTQWCFRGRVSIPKVLSVNRAFRPQNNVIRLSKRFSNSRPMTACVFPSQSSAVGFLSHHQFTGDLRLPFSRAKQRCCVFNALFQFTADLRLRFSPSEPRHLVFTALFQLKGDFQANVLRFSSRFSRLGAICVRVFRPQNNVVEFSRRFSNCRAISVCVFCLEFSRRFPNSWAICVCVFFTRSKQGHEIFKAVFQFATDLRFRFSPSEQRFLVFKALFQFMGDLCFVSRAQTNVVRFSSFYVWRRFTFAFFAGKILVRLEVSVKARRSSGDVPGLYFKVATPVHLTRYKK